MRKISITPGDKEGPESGAFDLAKLQAEGIDSMLLCQALAKALTPFAGLLREGCGIGLIVNGDEASLIGIIAESN